MKTSSPAVTRWQPGKWAGLVMGLALGCWLLACQSPAATGPANTIPDEKMARIMADLNIAEAATARMNGYPKDSLKQVYFKQVMEMHRVTVTDYEANLRVIVADQKRMEDLLKASEILLEEKPEGEIKKEEELKR